MKETWTSLHTVRLSTHRDSWMMLRKREQRRLSPVLRMISGQLCILTACQILRECTNRPRKLPAHLTRPELGMYAAFLLFSINYQYHQVLVKQIKFSNWWIYNMRNGRWTRSNSAFLNEPPREEIYGMAHKYTPQFNVTRLATGNA